LKAFLLVACVLVPASAYAQHFEIAPLTLFAHSSAVTIEPRAPNVDDLKIDGGFVWGAAGGFVFPSGLGIELHLRRQHTGLLLTSAGRTETLFYMTAYDVDGCSIREVVISGRHRGDFAGVKPLTFDTDSGKPIL